MKTVIFAAVASMLMASSTFAAESTQPSKGPGPNFEQFKSEVLTRIDARIARNQEEKTCVQAAKNHEDLKACRDKFMAEAPRPQKK